MITAANNWHTQTEKKNCGQFVVVVVLVVVAVVVVVVVIVVVVVVANRLV